jgi:hypothetical protein
MKDFHCEKNGEKYSLWKKTVKKTIKDVHDDQKSMKNVLCEKTVNVKIVLVPDSTIQYNSLTFIESVKKYSILNFG